MRRIVVGVAAILVGLGVLLTVLLQGAGRGAIAQQPQGTPRPGAVVVEPVERVPGPAIPTLTAAERTQAEALFGQAIVPSTQGVLTNEAQLGPLRQLLAGRSFTVTQAGVWHTSKSLQKLGAILTVRLAAPLTTGIVAWPAYSYDETESTSPPYREAVNNFGTTNATELTVIVDLNRNQVVYIRPTAGQTIVRPPGATPARTPTQR